MGEKEKSIQKNKKASKLKEILIKRKKIIIITSIILVLLISLTTSTILIKNNKKDYKKDNKIEVKEENSNKNNKQLPDLIVEMNDVIITPKKFELNADEYIIKYYDEYGTEVIFHEKYNLIGTFKLVVSSETETRETKITVKDTTKPELILQEITIKINEDIKLENFVQSCLDNSGSDCELKLLTEIKTNKKGTYDIEIEATDPSKNKSIENTKLIIEEQKNTTKEDKPQSNQNNQKPNNNTAKPNNTPTGGNTNSNTKPNTSKPIETPKEEQPEIKPEPPKPATPTLVETKKENVITKEEKYGSLKIITTEISYDLYSDGSKKNETSKVIKTEYDFSGFNGTTATLKNEAISNKTKYRSEINEVLAKTNEYRAEVGLNPLILDEDMTTGAMIRALESAHTNVLSHTRPNGTKYLTVLNELGVSYMYVGENAAAGYRTALSVSEGWKASAGHYSNMINQNYTKIGIGYANYNGYPYWIQLFTK